MADKQNVLDEAASLVGGDRGRTYGHPLDDARRFAQIASAATGLEIQPYHLPILMMSIKMSRIANSRWHRDSYVDMAGYVRVAEMIYDREIEEDDISDVQKAIMDTLRFP